jgi:hypothetical protein
VREKSYSSTHLQSEHTGGAVVSSWLRVASAYDIGQGKGLRGASSTSRAGRVPLFLYPEARPNVPLPPATESPQGTTRAPVCWCPQGKGAQRGGTQLHYHTTPTRLLCACSTWLLVVG